MVSMELQGLITGNPEKFFEEWSEQEFIYWLHVDRYGLPSTEPSKENLLSILQKVDNSEKLIGFYKIVLKHLIKIRDNDKSKKSSK